MMNCTFGIGEYEMKNTVLITGGNSGIGLALAVRYLKDGNTVIICGRNQEKLDKTVRALEADAIQMSQRFLNQ